MSEIYRTIKLTKKQHWLLWQMKDVCDEYFSNGLDEEDQKLYQEIGAQICHWNKNEIVPSKIEMIKSSVESQLKAYEEIIEKDDAKVYLISRTWAIDKPVDILKRVLRNIEEIERSQRMNLFKHNKPCPVCNGLMIGIYQRTDPRHNYSKEKRYHCCQCGYWGKKIN